MTDIFFKFLISSLFLNAELNGGFFSVLSEQLHFGTEFFGAVIGVGAHHAQEGVLVVAGLSIANHNFTAIYLLLFDFYDDLSKSSVVSLLLLGSVLLPSPHHLRDVIVAHVVKHSLVAENPALWSIFNVSFKGFGIGVALVSVLDNLIHASALEVHPELENINMATALQSFVASVESGRVVGSILVEEVRGVHGVAGSHHTIVLGQEKRALERDLEGLMGVPSD